MTEEEKKAIKVLEKYKFSEREEYLENNAKKIGKKYEDLYLERTWIPTTYERKQFTIVYNLIEKLQKENEEINKAKENGTLSDGYHTFNDLYYQRCVLFATICNLNKNIAWKSKRHSDGKKCFDSDNWFIVGIDTPEGSYTYHYEMKYWNLFDVQELELGKKWDGHTEKDVTRLLSLINNCIPKAKIRELLENNYDISTENSRSMSYDGAFGFVEDIEELLEEE